MAFCYELTSGCCGATVRSTVCIALSHYMFFGLFTICFVFTNDCYPPYSYPDFFFGGSGAALLFFSFLMAWTVDLRKCQPLRALMGLLVILSVLFTVVTCYYYTIVRWHDVIVTLIMRSLRSPIGDYTDYIWCTLVVLACITCPVFLIYLIYIASFMFNKWKSHLFTTPYMNNQFFSPLPPLLTIPRETYSTRSYKPYPVQAQ